ncbi:MAG: zinc-dependent metalloprotease [bacterium]|nr:zinc-dependent metalloprotease [bacterium]MDE0375329.1 zinc-dependent metalloprotease [bacterium]
MGPGFIGPGLMQPEDRARTLRVAGYLAGAYPLAGAYHLAALEEMAPTLVHRAGSMVEEETGFSGPGEPTVTVIDRLTWVERNLAFFTELLRPVEEKLEDHAEETGLGHRLAGLLMAMETGAVLGLLSRRVLGQYELLLPSDGRADQICLPAPNILEMERKFQLRPADFRFWVALHEVTHRLQFVGVPWLREYFLGLAGSLVSLSTPEDPSRLEILLSRAGEAIREGRPPVGEAGVLGLMATPAELEHLDRVQALMSLVEGHGHVVMDRIGQRQLVTWKRMSDLFTRRRHHPRVAALLRLSGLEMKLRQYDEGREFILAVEERAGWAAVNRAWESPETLPTRAEIKAPETWLARVA